MIESKDLMAPRSILHLSNMKKQMCSHKVALQMLQFGGRAADSQRYCLHSLISATTFSVAVGE